MLALPTKALAIDAFVNIGIEQGAGRIAYSGGAVDANRSTTYTWEIVLRRFLGSTAVERHIKRGIRGTTYFYTPTYYYPSVDNSWETQIFIFRGNVIGPQYRVASAYDTVCCGGGPFTRRLSERLRPRPKM